MRSLYKGLPQDSVLNPLLFNLYVKDILKNIPYNCKVVQFADDIVIFCQDKSLNKICSSLSKAFNRMNSWFLSINLELSVPKSQFIIFNRARKKILPDHVEVTGGIINRMNTVKYLGIKFDAELRWRDHIDYLKIKLQSHIFALTRLFYYSYIHLKKNL